MGNLANNYYFILESSFSAQHKSILFIRSAVFPLIRSIIPFKFVSNYQNERDKQLISTQNALSRFKHTFNLMYAVFVVFALLCFDSIRLSQSNIICGCFVNISHVEEFNYRCKLSGHMQPTFMH